MAIRIIFDDQRDRFRILLGANRQVFVTASSLYDTVWMGVRAEVDFAANNGAGSVSIAVRDATVGGAYTDVAQMLDIPACGFALRPACAPVSSRLP